MKVQISANGHRGSKIICLHNQAYIIEDILSVHRKKKEEKRFLAVTCHLDLGAWRSQNGILIISVEIGEMIPFCCFQDLVEMNITFLKKFFDQEERKWVKYFHFLFRKSFLVSETCFENLWSNEHHVPKQKSCLKH